MSKMPNSWLRFFAGTMLCLALANSSFAAENLPKLQDFVKHGMTQWNIPGMAVTVVSDDEVLFQQAFGKTTPGEGQPVGEHTLFAAASTNKAMVAAGILMLVDEGKLSLDDPISLHIPELHFSAPVLTQQISVRDLLAHRTGLPGTDFWTFVMNEPLAGQLKRLREVPPKNPLRSGFLYQNTMYELAGLLIERISGSRWDQFLRNRLWQPIGMAETYGARGQIPEDRSFVLPHNVINDELKRVDFDLPADLADAAGSTWTSIHDMGLWAQFLLRNGITADGERLLSEQSFDEMFNPQQLISRDSFYPSTELTEPQWLSYGLGWFQQDFQGRKIDFHTGSLSGLIAMIGVDRGSNKALVLLGNRDHAEMRHAVLWEVMDQTPETQRKDWNQAIWDLYQKLDSNDEEKWAEAEQKRLKDTRHSLPQGAYIGDYVSAAMGQISVVLENSQLIVRTPNADLPMSHWHLETFLVSYAPWELKEFATFQISPDGDISSLDLPFGKFELAKKTGVIE